MSKIDQCIAALTEWRSVPDLIQITGWQSHTLRGALSTKARNLGLTIERRRIDGVTNYRIKPDYDPEDDIRESVNLGLQTVKARMEAGGPAWPKDQ